MDENLATSIWRRKFNSVLLESGLPSRFHRPQTLILREADRDSWEYLEEVREDVVENVQNGSNIVLISSNVGNGKTSWAARLLQRYLAETALDGNLTCKGKFINCATLLSSLADFNYINTPEFSDEFKVLKTCELLVLDEIGAGRLNKVSYPYFYEIVNYRIDNQLSIISTTNYKESELVEFLGERLYSRLFDLATVVEFVASNVRGYEPDEIEEMEI